MIRFVVGLVVLVSIIWFVRACFFEGSRLRESEEELFIK